MKPPKWHQPIVRSREDIERICEERAVREIVEGFDSFFEDAEQLIQLELDTSGSETGLEVESVGASSGIHILYCEE